MKKGNTNSSKTILNAVLIFLVLIAVVGLIAFLFKGLNQLGPNISINPSQIVF